MEENKSVLKGIKEYLPLLVLIPTLIGGIIQIIQLLSLSSTFIRFFSITQALIDGLLSLTFIVVFTILLFALISLPRPLYKGLRKEILDSNWNKILKKIILFLFDMIAYNIIIFCSLLCLIFFIHSDFKISEVYRIVLFLSVSTSILCYALLNIKQNKSESDPEEANTSSSINWNHLTIYYLTCLFFILYMINGVNSRIYDIYNKENIYCYLKNQEFKYAVRDCEIQYFNDTYIFVKLHFKDTMENPLPENQKRSMIAVLKFDQLLDFKNCSELYGKS